MAEKNAEFGVVGSGSNFGQDLGAENWCTKHSETFEACGCEKKDRRAEPSGAMVTNETPTGDDPLDDSTLSGFDIVNVDSPSRSSVRCLRTIGGNELRWFSLW